MSFMDFATKTRKHRIFQFSDLYPKNGYLYDAVSPREISPLRLEYWRGFEQGALAAFCISLLLALIIIDAF